MGYDGQTLQTPQSVAADARSIELFGYFLRDQKANQK